MVFGAQSLRLLRTNWPTPMLLAEELYAIFQAVDSQPTQLTGPVTITNPGSAPAITTQGSGGGNNGIQVGNGNGSFYFNQGGINFENIIIEPGQTVPSSSPPATGGGIPGIVISGGPGAGPYLVKVYAKGTAFPGLSVLVKQLQIANDATIPAGTWTIVTKTTSGYFMQVPVWLPPVTTPSP